MSNNWTREQLIITFNLYCKIPFSKSVQTNPQVIEVAELIGRTPSAVAFKLGNFGSFDPSLKERGIGGLKNASRLDREIWDEFSQNWDELGFESERLIAEFKRVPFEVEDSPRPDGLDREAVVKVRVNQNFFRQAVLNIYGGSCCITGISDSSLLVASHIVPWKHDSDNRTNPANGLCLNALHDRAFDKGLITVNPDYEILVSPRIHQIKNSSLWLTSYFHNYQGKKISLPEKFLPEKSFLEFHYDQVYQH